MKRIHRDAVVHERTVQKAADHLADSPVRRRGKGKPKADLTHVRVLPDVWAKAIELSQGHPSRIQVLGPDNVVVHNHPWRNR